MSRREMSDARHDKRPGRAGQLAVWAGRVCHWRAASGKCPKGVATDRLASGLKGRASSCLLMNVEQAALSVRLLSIQAIAIPSWRLSLATRQWHPRKRVQFATPKSWLRLRQTEWMWLAGLPAGSDWMFTSSRRNVGPWMR